MVTVWSCTAASCATVPLTCPVAYDSPDGNPVTVTVGVSPSASVTVTSKAAIDAPCL